MDLTFSVIAMQERRGLHLVHRSPWLRPWVGPVGSRPVGVNRKPLAFEDVQEGVWVLAKARHVAEDLFGRRPQSPFELCRVVEKPQYMAEDMLVHVEFMFADRCGPVRSFQSGI